MYRPTMARSKQFQSAPDQLIGRYDVRAGNFADAVRFQSAPDQLIGRYVSAGPDATINASFNPRPTN